MVLETTEFTAQDIDSLLQKMPETRCNGVKLLFAPSHITVRNLEQVVSVYREIQDFDFDTVVFVEPYRGELPKKILLPSFSEYQTPFGNIPVNEKLRDEFCDEDDDFYIDDSGLHDAMAYHDHLAVIKNVMGGEFNAVVMQLADESNSIIRELSSAVSELMFGRNVLVVFCCNLDPDYINEFEQVRTILMGKQYSQLMNYINSGSSKIDGVGTFIAGILVAKEWELDITFLNEKFEHLKGNSLIAGFAGFPKN